ncbi:MAG: hypothetical protein Q4D80_05345, partial [Pseudomonadota bacterium]|nr:hypothetical protein [Pseudomonadota bacterium]
LETNGAIEGAACGKCVEDTPSEPEEKKNCTDYGLMSQTYCETEIGDVFEFRRTDDYGARCGTCDCTYTYRYLDDEKLRNLIIEEYNPSIENGLADIWYDDELDYYLFEVCLKGTKCYDKISKNPAVYTGVADKYDQELLYPMFDRIDGNSKSCLRYDEDGKEYWYFEKLCEGTPKEKCTKKFTPNGCRSYTVGGAWLGTEWGDCYCDTTENQYDEQNTCQQQTGENCTRDDNDCYRTCKSFGYYNSREDCEHVFSGKNYECLKVEGTDCYKPSYFTLYFKKQMKLHNGADGNVDIFLTTIKDNKRPNPVHMDDSDLWKKYYVSAGKYYVWVRSGELSPKITVSWENGKSCFVETDYNRGEHDYYKGDICKNIGKTIRKTDQVDQSLSVFDFNFVAGRNYKVSVEYAY